MKQHTDEQHMAVAAPITQYNSGGQLRILWKIVAASDHVSSAKNQEPGIIKPMGIQKILPRGMPFRFNVLPLIVLPCRTSETRQDYRSFPCHSQMMA